jgi:ubiquinone/menaquinone biosynthesis C-methylase UbiE
MTCRSICNNTKTHPLQKNHQSKIVRAIGATPGDVVLDVGSGTGLFLKSFSEGVGPQGLVVATDLAGSMCDRLRERTREEGLHNVAV